MWGHEGHIKGDKPGRCASRGEEMQIKQTVSRGPALQTASASVETNGVLVLFIKYFWFSII
jgi:hypothetical protein